MAAALLGFAAAVATPAAAAPASLVLRAGSVESLPYRLAQELAEALRQSAKARIALKVETSAGPAADAADAIKENGAAMFVSEPGWVHQAEKGKQAGPIRLLFPLPFFSLHWVVRQDGGVTSLAALAGQPFVAGAAGSFTAEETAAALKLESAKKPIRNLAIDGERMLRALADNKVAGFAEATAFPAPNILALAKKVPLRLLSVPRGELSALLAESDGVTAMVIPRRTYPGISTDTVTVALPLGVYTTTAMGKDEAYRITKAFWAEMPALAARDPRWAALTPDALAALGAPLHPGALQYYAERGLARGMK